MRSIGGDSISRHFAWAARLACVGVGGAGFDDAERERPMYTVYPAAEG